MPPKSILSIGQCGYDDSRLAQLARAAGATLTRAADAPEALQLIAASHPSLILLNRIFDSTGDSGVEFIPALLPTAIPLMLVSDFPSAQSAATAAGALPGFGKSQINDPGTLQKIQQALAERPA